MKINWKQAWTSSLFFIFILILTLMSFQVSASEKETGSAVESDGTCEHHPFHTEECGYVEAVPEIPCAHIHTEDCYRWETHCIYEDPVQAGSGQDESKQDESGRNESGKKSDESETSSDMAHVCSEATGCVVKKLDCQHQHDEMCGYAPAVSGHPCEFVCPVCSQVKDVKTTPYYLLLIHTLDYNGTQYGFSEVIVLTEEELQDGNYDLHRHVLEKDGMTVAGISCYNPETGNLEEIQVLSPDSFDEGGDPETGENYYAAQALIEYRVLDGYNLVLEGNSPQLEDPYGIMPLTNFEGGNIKDIIFVPADVLTVQLEYKYSPTGGLAGMDAADSQIFQMNVADAERDSDGNIVMSWDLPCYDEQSQKNPTLEGFRIVLDPAPLNQFVNRPDLAEKAMNGGLSQAEIQEALENDSFSVNVNNPDRKVYQWQDRGENPPAKYEDYPLNTTYNNRYSKQYNEAWDDARDIETELYEAQATQKQAAAHQGANPLNNPQIVLTMTPEQCAEALKSDKEVKITVYYRRNAGFYHVGHWVPRASLSSTDRSKYEADYSAYNTVGVDPYDNGYLMVYLERKQGRVGALTNARAYPHDSEEVEKILSAFTSQAINQQTIKADTRVDILYDTADRYGLIFQTEESYIPRQYVNKGYTVTFLPGTGDSSGMQVKDKDGNSVNEYLSYKNPVRQGYTFAGWKYEVRDDVTDTDVSIENDRHYRIVATDKPWKITEEMVEEAVVVRDSDSGDAKMIYLYPVWTPNKANVRVVYWTEDLSGGNKDVQVTVDNTDGGAGYRTRVSEYLNDNPDSVEQYFSDNVGKRFSNVGSFTFWAPTNSILDLSMENGAFVTGTDETFTTTGDTAGHEGTLKELIDDMFSVKMSPVRVFTGVDINTSKFYHPYQVDPKAAPDIGDAGTKAVYTVAADGSTVINIYYARNVYKLDFTYYGKIDGNDGRVSGTVYDGLGGLVVATNTTAYSKRNPKTIGETFDYNYQNPEKNENRWQLVKNPDDPKWTVPETLTIYAKYDADLREVWPLSQGETIDLTLKGSDTTNGLKDVATFMSWGATAGPFNESYRNGSNNESTIIGNYRSMSADIIADPEKPSTVHHLVAYWWNKALSNYRRNACYEVPELTANQLIESIETEADKGTNKKTKTYDLTERTIVYDFEFEDHTVGKDPLYGLIAGSGKDPAHHVSEQEKIRRDTLYLVPVDGDLHSYFDDYRSNFIEVDETGEPKAEGGYYAVRRISLDDDSKVYALGRQAASVSTNWIALQAPSTMPNMTSVSLTYVCDGKELGKGETEDDPLIKVDHDTRAWDNWGRTETALGWPAGKFEPFVALGSAENPYDIWFYYDRARFTIFYIVASRNSISGEYEIGRHETIYGQNSARYNLKLDPEDAREYSNDEKFKDYWTATKNSGQAISGSSTGTNGLNEEDYTRLCPDSAENGTGEWTCEYWSLDRSGSGAMKDEDWKNSIITGNLRVFAQWTPPQYKVRFDFDKGSYNGLEDFPVQTVKANVGYTSSGNPIPSPTRDGYVFNGWSWYEGDGEDLKIGDPLKDFTFETPITRNVVLKAKWKLSVKMDYNYKIWYLTDDQGAETETVTLPKVEGNWLDDNRGTPHPDSQHEDYRYVLGCQYLGDKKFPENTVLSLAAVAIPGYAPVEISTTLALDKEKNGTGAVDTENVAYFYYRKSQVKSYTVRFQLWNKTGDEGILPEFTIQDVIADSTFFTPGEETWKGLRDAGYYLVQMDENGTVKMDGGEPVAAKSYLELSDFINREITRFDGQSKGTNMIVTFKVAPFLYKIQYHVGTVKRDGAAITPGNALKQAMQTALDDLSDEAVQSAVAARKNPTRYTVDDFSRIPSFTLKNPPVVKDPKDVSKKWRFTGWSPAPGTNVVSGSRSVDGEYPVLEIERSEGDLEFLANWEMVDNDAPKPNPPSPDQPPAKLPDPNISGTPEVVTILEDGESKTYRKVLDPETDTWSYIPDTGENSAFPWRLINILSLFGLAAIWLPRFIQNRRKRNR